jgi:hypothetical protein
MTSIPTFTRNDIESRVHRAIEELRKHDGHLLDVDASERSITHHLAVYLQQEFEGWKVDVEYNRDGHDIKRLRDLPDVRSDKVYPDIIVHRRGTNDHNLLVVEVKKMDCGHDLEDEMKLVEFTKPLKGKGLNYRWGLHLILQGKEQGTDSLHWYEQGKLCEE